MAAADREGCGTGQALSSIIVDVEGTPDESFEHLLKTDPSLTEGLTPADYCNAARTFHPRRVKALWEKGSEKSKAIAQDMTAFLIGHAPIFHTTTSDVFDDVQEKDILNERLVVGSGDNTMACMSPVAILMQDVHRREDAMLKGDETGCAEDGGSVEDVKSLILWLIAHGAAICSLSPFLHAMLSGDGSFLCPMIDAYVGRVASAQDASHARRRLVQALSISGASSRQLMDMYFELLTPEDIRPAAVRSAILLGDLSVLSRLVDWGVSIEGMTLAGCIAATRMRSVGRGDAAADAFELSVMSQDPLTIPYSCLASEQIDDISAEHVHKEMQARWCPKSAEAMIEACKTLDAGRAKLLLSLGYSMCEACFDGIAEFRLRGLSVRDSRPGPRAWQRDDHYRTHSAFQAFVGNPSVDECIELINVLASVKCPVPDHIWFTAACTGRGEVFDLVRRLYPEHGSKPLPHEMFNISDSPGIPNFYIEIYKPCLSLSWDVGCMRYFLRRVLEMDRACILAKRPDWAEMMRILHAFHKHDTKRVIAVLSEIRKFDLPRDWQSPFERDVAIALNRF